MVNKIKYPIIDGSKECGDCHQIKPISNYRKARNHYTSRCVDCLKIYSAKYRRRPEIKVAMLAYTRTYRKNPINRERINANCRRHRKKPEFKAKRNQCRRNWTAKEKRKAVEYKGNKCVICGYDKCLAAMDFHHKNPLEKDGYGTGALKSHWSFERNKKELDKCVLLCVRCHREIHAGVIVL